MSGKVITDKVVSTDTSTSPSWLIAVGVSAIIAAVLVGLSWTVYSKLIAEKMLTTLAMPVGFTWLLLCGRLSQLVALGRWRLAVVPGMLWLGITIFGTNPLPTFVKDRLVNSVASYDPTRDGKLDVVVVLGGGTSQGAWRSEASEAGDRLVLGAEMYHRGLTTKLLTTGSATEGISGTTKSPADQTIAIWTHLGIPSEAILKSPGRNTFEELQNVKALFADTPNTRIGLVTSGIHLPRAVRLAKSAGLEVVPIAAQTAMRSEPFELMDFIPNGGNLGRWAYLQHELMAGLVKR